MTQETIPAEQKNTIFTRLSQLGAEKSILVLCWIFVPLVCLGAVIVENNPVLPGGLAFAFALTASLGANLARNTVWAPAAAGMGLTGQAIALTAAFSGHPWQTDTHMLFFALLAIVGTMGRVRAILASVVLIAVHHISFGVLVPSLIYPSVDLLVNLQRTALHAVIVVVEAAVLIFAAMSRQQMDASKRTDAALVAETARTAEVARDKAIAAQQEAQNAVAKAEQESLRAKQALEAAETAQKEAQIAHEARRKHEEEAERTRAKNTAEQSHVVEALRRALIALEEGDLTSTITDPFAPQYDDLRVAFNGAVAALHAAIGEVAEQATLVDDQAAHITSASKSLAERTERQAATLQETAAAIDQLNESLASASAAVAQSATRAQDAQTSAKDTESIVKVTNDSMHQIEASSGEINQIVTVIDDIAFQTNLLALNAGVEAARAGEAGRGFSVVASEVRALAQRSSDSAQSIRTLIEASVDQISGGVQHMDSSVEALANVLTAIGDISGQMSDIAASAKEQANGIGSVNNAVTKLEQVTQQNAAMFEETTAASAELSHGAHRVLDLTRKFRTSASTPREASAA